MANYVDINNLKTALQKNNDGIENKYGDYIKTIDNVNLRSVVGEELEYGEFGFNTAPTITTGNTLYPLQKKLIGNLELTNYGTVKLKKNRIYTITGILKDSKSITDGVGLYIKNFTNEEIISTIVLSQTISGTSTAMVEKTYKPSNDCEIGFFTLQNVSRIPALTSGVEDTKLIINEINRTYIIDPMDVKDNYTPEYLCLTKDVANTQTLAVNDYIKFDKIVSNSSKLTKISNDPLSGVFTVQAGTYEIDATVQLVTNSSACSFWLYNVTNGVNYTSGSMSLSTNLADSRSGVNLSIVITVDVPTQLAIRIGSITGTPICYGNGYTKVNIKEFVQPVVVEYTNTNIKIVDPMDAKDIHIPQYLEMNSVQSNMSLAVNTIIPFTTVSGNLNYNLSGVFTLEAYKTYKIDAWLRLSGSGSVDYTLRTPDNSLAFGMAASSVSSNYSSVSNDTPYSYTMVVGSSNVDVCFKVLTVAGTTTFSRFHASVQEVSQPVILEYTKSYENTNQLSTSQIAKESPLGSIITYSGLVAPEHYLSMDGSILNISEYQQLADHIKNTFGRYDYWGGDGVLTFKLPLEGVNYVKNSPVLTSNTAPAPYVASANAVESTNFPAWKAFNGNSDTIYDSWSSGTTTGWLKLDCGSPIMFNSFLLQGRFSANLTTFPKNFILYGSNNDSTYVKIKEFTNQTISKPSETKFYALDTTYSYRYLRLDISATGGGTSVCIGELSFVQVYDIKCIKYEPTYYGVNQYGGFQTNVLFDGNASTVGTYSLSDSIENYNYLYVFSDSGNNSSKKSEMVHISDLDYASTNNNRFCIGFDETEYKIYYNFKSSNTFLLNSKHNASGYENSRIYKIIGFKGQIPSLLKGGTI